MAHYLEQFRFKLARALSNSRKLAVYATVSIAAIAAILYSALPDSKPANHMADTAISLPTRAYSDLSASDIHLYSQAFLAAKHGDHTKVDDLIAQTDSQVLLGHVLAERYLHENYKTNKEELALWLENFSDHPQTERIARLAGRKGFSGAKDYADISPLLSGKGYTDHLGARALPTQWYQGLGAWRKADYAKAAQYFVATSTQKKLAPSHRAAAHFWAARAYSKMAKHREARDMLRAASEQKHTLYGMLAGKILGQSLHVVAASPYMSAQMEDAPEYVRARALAAVGQQDLAESELRKLFMQVAPESRREILAMAGELGLPNLQIRLSKLDTLSEDEQVFASYPIPQHVVDAADNTDPALVLAVARQESAFREEVNSPAGAKGMMQVMPITAKHVISHPQFASLGDNSLTYADLMQASTNIKVGASYLNMLAKKQFIAGNLLKTLAAYNAGPGNVANWNKSAASINDPLLYLESIPFPETRNYVVQVLAHYTIYQSLMGESDSALSQLAKGHFPTYIPS